MRLEAEQEVPYIDVRVIPARDTTNKLKSTGFEAEGERRLSQVEILNFQDKLGFGYEVEMVNAYEVKIQVKFENAEYVSASYPEDEIEFSFWGPFIDRSNGLQLEKEEKVKKLALPTQVVDGAITETVDSTG